jgi:sugar/nucleoside kinase (ribokinase family)
VTRVRDRPTLQSVCYQYPDGSGGNLTTSDSAAATLQAADVDAATRFVDEGTIVLAVPEAPLDARHRLLRLGRARDALAVAALASVEMADAASRRLFDDVDLLALNEDEAAALTGVPFASGQPGLLLDACARTLTQAQPMIRIVVTAGASGAFGFESGQWFHVPALATQVAGTAGAGDALLGGLLAALAAGLPFLPPGCHARRSLGEGPIDSALELGVLLAAYKVTSSHAIHPHARLSSLRSFARNHGISMGPSLSLRQSTPVRVK